jgi:hypothetical protein
MTELAAGCHNSSTATLAYGSGEMLILKYFLEPLDTGRRRSLKSSPRILVEGDEINLGPKPSQKLGQLSSCLRRVIHTSKEKILEGDPVTSRQFQVSARF